MVINNPYYININKKPVEVVHELKDEYKIPSFEEFMKTYDEPNEESEFLVETEYQDRVLNGPQYGPGNEKKNKGKKKTSDNGIEYNGQHLINTLNNKWGERTDWWDVDKSSDKKGDWRALSLETSAGAGSGVGGVIAGGTTSFSGFKYSDGVGDVRFGSGSVGGEAGIGLGGATVGYSANLDVMNLHTNSGIRANVGADFGSNLTAGSGGVEVKAAGFGVSVGKKMGFSTPLGGVSVDLEETCNQQ